MNLDDLRNANFSNFDKAVSAWDAMAGKLSTLAGDVRSDVKGKADKADWAGMNATVSREFIQKTSTECDGLVDDAKSIHNILSGAASALKGYQTQLTERIALEKDCYVKDNGNGTFTVEVRDDAPDGTDTKAETLKNDIEGILKKATDKDKTTAETLDALAKLTDLGSSGVSYSSEDEAAKALKDAARAAELGAIDPMEMSPEEFDELNDLMGAHQDDPLFSEKFATTLGPEGTLNLWAGLNDINSPLARERHEEFAAFQENLSLTLATATHSDSDAMTRWKWDMADLGDQRVGGTQKSYGFQVMSNLMRVGDYDDQFLNNYGNQLIATEKKLTQNGEIDDARYWMMGNNGRLNWMGGDEADNGRDPFVGFMKGLSHSPDASTEFFNNTFVTKDEDHPFENGDGEKRELSNFDYLFEERDWPESMHLEGGGTNNDFAYNAMGEALEAATTGHPAGEAPTSDLPPHSEEQANLTERIISSVSEDPKRLTDHDVMSDSMGRMTAEYLPDFNRSMADDGEHGNIDKLFPIAGSQADMEHSEATRFLLTVGQDPEGYAAVEIGQKTYAANLMDYHLNPDLPADQRFSDDPQDVVETISRRSGEIGGTLALGRQEAVIGPANEEDSAFNHALAQGKNVVSGAVGIGVGVGTTFVASPVGGVVAGGAAGTATSVILDEIVKTAEANSDAETMAEAGPMWERAKENNINLTQQSANMSGEYHQIADADDAADWARTGTLDGFGDAESNANRTAADILSEVE